MSSISSTTSSANPYQTTQSSYAQSRQDFKALGTALQSGDLSSAQSALAAFQQDTSGNSQTSSTSQSSNSTPFGKNTQANTDFQSLTSALQSGDLAGAQKAFASLQTDLKSAHGHHRHHHAGSGTSAASGTGSTSATDNTGNASSATTGTTASSTTSTQGTNILNLLG